MNRSCALISSRAAFGSQRAIGFALALGLLVNLSAEATERQQLHTLRTAAGAHLQPVGRLQRTNHLQLAIGLPLRNRPALTNLLHELYDPTSTQYRRFLTPDQFTASFGPTEQDYQAAINFARANGFAIAATHLNRLLLNLDGSVADVERTFHVNMRWYPQPTESRNFYAPDTEPSLDLVVPISHIAGLDNYTRPHPMSLRETRLEAAAGATPRVGSGPSGSFMGSDFRAAYVPSTTLDGTGEMVGLFELDGFYLSDINAYKSQAGLPDVPLENVLIDGFSGTPQGRGQGSGNEEVALDIEMAISMAPGLSKVLVYEGSPTANSATIDHVLNRMATDNRARQLSCSWGFDIDAISQQIFLQYAAQGQSFYLASGDTGAFADAALQPSDNPNVTVVGGTILTTASSGGWASEKVWSGSSGGISSIYPIPEWQQGLDMSKNQGSTTMRNIPDVAMVAQNVWLMADRGRAFAVSGTSIAAPLWAAFSALVNQQGAASGQPPVGFINPAVYALGRGPDYTALFHDVLTGNNVNANSPNRFFAAHGYDLCTGWGSPNGQSLIDALLVPPTEPLFITSPLGFTASGPVGGPFNVTSQTFTLTNLGTAPLNWSLVNTSAWLNATPTSGTLAPGGSATTVTVSLDSSASQLLLGAYPANVVLLNMATGAAQRREFNLLVGNAGFENGDFSNWTVNADNQVNFANSVDLGQFRNGSLIPEVDDALFVHSGIYGAFLGQNTTLGFLSQTLPTIPGQSYLVSFWLTNPTNGVPNEFRASWAGNVLLDQVNIGKSEWTNFQFIVTAPATSAVLSFGFRNDPNAFGLDDISVQALTTTSRTISLIGNLDFGEVSVGGTAPALLTIANSGNTNLTVTGIDYPPGFSGAWSGMIPPGGSQPVTVVFAPTEAIAYDGVVTVNSDRTEGTNTLTISGTGKLTGTVAAVLIDSEVLTQVYNGLPKVITASTFPPNIGLVITYNGSLAPPTAAGNYLVTASINEPGYAGSASATLTITPAVLTVTANDAIRSYGATNPAFSATITGFVNGETEAVVSGAPALTTSATPTSPAGVYPIIPSQGTLSATNYAFGSFTNGTLLVTPAALTVTANDAIRSYGATNPAFSATITGFVNGETEAVVSGVPVLTTSATPTSPAGVYPIIPSQGTLTATNYAFGRFTNGTLLVTPAALTVTANDATRPYGATNPAFSATITGFVNGETEAVVSGAPVLTTSATPTSPAGVYPIIPSQGTLTATNYAFGRFTNGTLLVTSAVLAVTANDATRPYGATNPAFSATITGFVNGETEAVVSGAPALTTSATPTSPAGVYPIIPSQGTLSATNYAFGSFTNGTLLVTPAALTVTANDAIRSYGATNPAFSATITGFVNGETEAVVSGVPVLTTSATPTSPAGVYPIIPSQGTLTATNYAFGRFTNGTLLVTSAVLTVTANDATRPYGATNPAFSATITGFVNGETEAVVSGAPALTTSATPTSPAGVYPIIPSQGTLTATNYAFGRFTNGTLLVTSAVLAVTANDATRPYGATNPVFSATITGFVNGETEAVVSGAPALTTSATPTSPAGVYPIIPSQGTMSATNYAFGSFTNGTLLVTPAALTVTANDAIRSYGATNPAFSATITGFVNGETEAVVSGAPALTTSATPTSPAGVYPIIPSQGTLTATNYTFNDFINGTLTIAAVDVTLFSPSLAGGTFTVSVMTAVGFTYTLEFKDSLDDLNWQPGQSVAGTGTAITLTDQTPAPAARYYRVRTN